MFVFMRPGISKIYEKFMKIFSNTFTLEFELFFTSFPFRFEKFTKNS